MMFWGILKSIADFYCIITLSPCLAPHWVDMEERSFLVYPVTQCTKRCLRERGNEGEIGQYGSRTIHLPVFHSPLACGARNIFREFFREEDRWTLSSSFDGEACQGLRSLCLLWWMCARKNVGLLGA